MCSERLPVERAIPANVERIAGHTLTVPVTLRVRELDGAAISGRLAVMLVSRAWSEMRSDGVERGVDVAVQVVFPQLGDQA
jgi:hypothetical protein